MLKKHVLRLLVGLVALLVGSVVMGEQSVSSTIRQMTGARTKIAWVRGSEGIGHPFGPGMGEKPNIWRIVVIDTDVDGGQERYLTEQFGDYNHIEITPDGKRVLWTCSSGIWVSDWDGKNQRKILDKGCTVGVSEDKDGKDWVYVKEAENEKKITPIVRYMVDDVTKSELVWDKTNSNDKWEVSRDGTWAASAYPPVHAGVAQLPNGEFYLVGDGCTPGSDGEHITHMRAQGHGGIYVYDMDGENMRYIDFTQNAPGAKDVVFPQFWWCNFARYNGRFYSFSGPHPNMSYSPLGSNIYFCRFNEKFDNFDKWVIVTDDPEQDTQSYVWIDPNTTPTLTDGLEIDETIDAQMGASLTEPVIVTVKNTGKKRWQGSVKLTLAEGLKAQPEKAALDVKPGETKSVTLNIVKDPELNKGKFRKLSVQIAVCDSKGKTIDWSRQWLKVGCPVELTMSAPTKFDEANQPVPVLVRNLANKPVSGTIKLTLQGPGTIGPIEQPFGPIAGGKEAIVDVVVPGLKLRGYNWSVSFSASANGLETGVNYPLVIERRWLLLGPFPSFPKDGRMGDGYDPQGYDYDFGPEKELAAGLDLTKTYALPADIKAPTTGGWDGLRQDWDKFLKSGTQIKWTPSPAVRVIPGGPHEEAIGYLNLYDYYQDIVRLPNQMAASYALVYVKSPDARKVVMHTGQAGWMRVWINGKEVLSDKTQRGANPSTVKTEVELQAGWNEVVMKQGSAFYGYGFYFDFRTADNKSISDLYWTVAK